MGTDELESCVWQAKKVFSFHPLTLDGAIRVKLKMGADGFLTILDG